MTTNREVQQLTEWAAGSLPLMAAAHMLTRSPQCQRLWPVLVQRRHDDRPWLAVESAFTHLNDFGLSSGERAVALLILELAGHNTGTSIADILSGLDPRNMPQLVEAARILTE